MKKIKLRLLRDMCIGYGFPGDYKKKGDIIEYEPWDHEACGLSEKDRLKNGIYFLCHGHGVYTRLDKDKDVKVINE